MVTLCAVVTVRGDEVCFLCPPMLQTVLLLRNTFTSQKEKLRKKSGGKKAHTKKCKNCPKARRKKCTQQFVYSTINLRVRKMLKIHEKATMLTQTRTCFSTRASGPRHSTAEFRCWGCFHLLSAAPLPPPMHPFMNTGTVTWSKQCAEHTKPRPCHAPRGTRDQRLDNSAHG